MIIEGERVGAASGQTYQVVNPATGEVVEDVPNGSAEDVDRAARAAQRAQRTWAHLAANKIAPAIAAGNAVVLKPSSTTPLATLRCVEALIEGGLPEGVVNVVLGPGTGEAIVTHPLIRKVALTGSTPTGKKVMAAAAPLLKKVVLELGGSDPCIVLDDADLDEAARAISVGRFFNCGQACLAIKRLYVQDGVFDALLERLVERAKKLKPGNGMDRDTRMGPMHSRSQPGEVEAQVHEAVDRGARIVFGGGRPEGPGYEKGYFI